MEHRKLCKQSRFHPGYVKDNYSENCQCSYQVEVMFSDILSTVVVNIQVIEDELCFLYYK